MILALAAGLALAAEDPDWIARPPPAIPVRMIHVMDQYRYFIDCVANRDWVTARPLFDTPLRSRDEGRALARIGGGSHGSGCSYAFEMRMTGILMRGGIAEARYRQIYGRGATLPVDPAVAPVADGAVFAWVGFGHESDAQTLYDLATCLAARETGAVHAVLMTRQASDQERAAFQALSRRFGTCLRPGRPVRANSLTFRPWLGEAQYQLFRARQPDQAN
jgi:hypothetical protein